MTTQNYKPISITAYKTGRCPICGKRYKAQKRFWQTSNPFNNYKSREQILNENHLEAEKWRSEDYVHDKCKGGRSNHE